MKIIILYLSELHEYQILQFVQKAFHHPNLLPTIFNNYFVTIMNLFMIMTLGLKGIFILIVLIVHLVLGQ